MALDHQLQASILEAVRKALNEHDLASRALVTTTGFHHLLPLQDKPKKSHSGTSLKWLIWICGPIALLFMFLYVVMVVRHYILFLKKRRAIQFNYIRWKKAVEKMYEQDNMKFMEQARGDEPFWQKYGTKLEQAARKH